MIAGKTHVRFESLQSYETEMVGLYFGRFRRPYENPIESKASFEVRATHRLQVVVTQLIPSVLQFFSSASLYPHVINTFWDAFSFGHLLIQSLINNIQGKSQYLFISNVEISRKNDGLFVWYFGYISEDTIQLTNPYFRKIFSTLQMSI